MEYLHSVSLIHRDLACRNILVSFETGAYIVKISDFGMARPIEKYYYSESAQIPIRVCHNEVVCLLTTAVVSPRSAFVQKVFTTK